MRAKLLITSILLLLCAWTWAITNCECGNHEIGITAYSVTGPGCCSSNTTGGTAIYHTYVFNEGAWAYSQSFLITSQAAQSFCCTAAQTPGD